MPDIYEKLCASFPTDKVRWRVGQKTKDGKKVKMLAYIDARDVMQRLDDVVEWDGWSDKYEYHGNTCVCYLTVNDVTKADGSAETAVEAEKGQLSKALVRAGVKFGIGRYLYDLENVWIPADKVDRYGNVDESEQWKLDKALGKAYTKPKKPEGLSQVFKDTADAITDLKELEKAGKMDRPEEEKEYIRKRYAKLKKEQE